MSSIEFDHISKSYSETRVLDDVSLTFSSSQTSDIVGERGSGR